ncbi:MAG: PhoH family protein, partial [Betaproteobacteria bacterium]|nr:PhoH family protein [Betaproteobacteria bacterium]
MPLPKAPSKPATLLKAEDAVVAKTVHTKRPRKLEPEEAQTELPAPAPVAKLVSAARPSVDKPKTTV